MMCIAKVRKWILAVVVSVPLSAQVPAEVQMNKEGKANIEHEVKCIEGWDIHIDSRLLEGEHAPLGKLTQRILAAKLFEITLVVPEDRLQPLQTVRIYLDLDHPLKNLQYHPSAGWLKKHEYDPKMAKAVHIPRAERLVNLLRRNHQPWVLLHELAHAYHDQVLGFNHKPVLRAYAHAVSKKLYKPVLHIRGKKVSHYALTNHKEYFAELTEAYFGTNDFYPFVRAELKEYDPEGFAVLEEIWGKRE